MIILYVLIVLIVLYLIGIMPKMVNRPSMEAFGKYFAHRGLHDKIYNRPENSLSAFKEAMDKNYSIELDVQLSKDGVPLVFHDKSLKRVCGVDQYVWDLTFKELQELRLLHTQEKIPHFKEVLDLIDGKVPLLIELKTETKDISICDVVAPLLDYYKGLYCIEAFNPLVLGWFKKNRPKVIRGQLSSDFVKEGETGDKRLYFVLKNLLLNFWAKPDFIAFHYKYKNSWSFSLCNMLYKPITIAWTITSKELIKENQSKFNKFIFENFIPNK